MTFGSPFRDVNVPDESVFDFLFADLDSGDSERPALIDGISGETITYGQLVATIRGVAATLTARGLTVGAVIALYAPNSPAFAAVFHGILRSGCTATTVNALYTSDEVAHQLVDSRASLVFTVSVLAGRAVEAAVSAGLSATDVVVIDSDDPLGPTGLEGFIATACETDLDAVHPFFAPSSHIAVLPYSSGTTGRPKGVMLTHRNLVANACQIDRIMGIGRNDRVLALLPFFHIYGMTVLLNAALRRRATLVTMPRFELAQFLRTVSDFRCTYLFIAPPLAIALAKHPLVDEYDLDSVHTILSGAAPLDAALGRAVGDRLGCRVRQGYGMSEMSPVSHAIPAECDDISLASVGYTVPNMQCKLLDPQSGAEIEIPDVGISAPGELCCRGPNVMAGYLGNPEATAAALDADGFLHTGDIATVDSRGVVTIVDRLKELIKYKGYQVPPAELEAVLLTHPAIADAAVIGALDHDGEEIPKAFVVRGPGADIDVPAVIAYVAERVAPHKKVRAVEFVDVVPKSSTGKILRRELRARPGNGQEPR
ncbi:AMP-binding protein [Nocardia sp. BSTN01]|uniref:AMP-binding protein n=1 Tax=Nocardia sp. BSTN01 TaxID=2783665 RepID=UPI00189017E8|nr:AMP-binding protein [Nocardia sp. BSTN01]MBF5000507.1 AMP-binding protein [Nocardia sp. BSTN01]